MKWSKFLASIFFLQICFFISCVKQSNHSVYSSLKENFLSPPPSAQPKVYWWCLNGNIDTVRARQELTAMKEAGLSGFDFFEIGARAQDTMIPAGPAFMSDESVGLIKYVAELAKDLDLTMGLNLSSSWNAGGSWVKPEHAGKSLYSSEIIIQGDSENQNTKLPFPEITFPKEMLIGGTDQPMIPFKENGKPEYYEEISVLAIPANTEKNTLDTSQIIDVTHFFNPETEILNWTVPEGEWRICRYVCSNSGQQLVLPSPKSAGLTIDHFDSTAVETHLMYFIDRLQPVLGDFENSALKSFYLASYEARGFVWTSSLVDEFQNLNGYDIRKYIPTFFEADLFPDSILEKVQNDFKKTLSELMINNLYKKSAEICNKYGLQINCEAGGPGYPLYNGPAEPLKALGALDIPRGEFWVNHSRYYTDNKGDTLDVLRVVKEVAAASHIYEKGIVEEEAFTSFMHWQEGPGDIKPNGDRAFCEGMNKVVFHGFSHNISEAGFPGFVYGAGTHFNDKRVWWTKAKPFIDYQARLSAVFQESDFFADVLWYYGDKIPNSATSKNGHFSVGPGYDYEVINTEILLDSLSVENGKLVLSNGAEFSLMVLEDEDFINPQVLIKVKELVEKGATVLSDKPEGIFDVKNPPLSREEAKNTIDKLWQEYDSKGNENAVYSGISALQVLGEMNIQPDINYPDKETFLLDFIHYKKEDVDFYFVVNTSNERISREVKFRQKEKTPEIWDPVSGEIVPVSVFAFENETTTLPVTLAPYGSQLFVFRKTEPVNHYTKITSREKSPPLINFTTNGFNLLESGDFVLKSEDNEKSFVNEIKKQTIDGEWKVSFNEKWGAPEEVVFPELISWTESDDEGIKYYSGNAIYKNSFTLEKQPNSDGKNKIILDLGEVSKVAEVWLNGENLGISWTKPYCFDVTNIIKNGENELTIEVANTWSNRLTGDAITGESYTNSNIRNTIIPAPTIKSGDQTRYPWKDVPLIKSGLLGPVKIKIFNPIENNE